MTARWYIVHAYSNFEKKVAEDIEKKAEQKGLKDRIVQVVVPTEKVVEVRRGKKVDAERKFFPGYVLLKADLNDAVISLVKNTPRVTGFLGEDKHTAKPMPITEKEAEHILNQVKEGVERPKPSVTFEIGEQIRVSDGPFASFNGFVQEVDEERARLKVEVSIFGRAVPVDLEFGQVEKS
jgi:transcriptional antiterminator NusG